MKRLTILFMLFLTSCILYAKDRKGNDLSGPIALKGELTEKYRKVLLSSSGEYEKCAFHPMKRQASPMLWK